MTGKLIMFASILVATTIYAQDFDKATNNQQQRSSLQQQMGTVIFIDHELNRLEHSFWGDRKTVKISLEQFGDRLSPTGTKEVFAIFKNRTDYDLVMEIRTSFFGAGNFPLDDVTAWRQVFMPANAIGNYRDISISQNVASYIIEVRQAD